MNTREPLSVNVVKHKILGQSVVPPGSYDVVELPNGRYRLEGEEHIYEVEVAWLQDVTTDAKAAIYSKWV